MLTPDAPGTLHESFRYSALKETVTLSPNQSYLLLLSTRAGDGDYFRDAIPFDGLPPLMHPSFTLRRAVMFRDGDLTNRLSLPAFADLNTDHSRYRMPVGPTLRFANE